MRIFGQSGYSIRYSKNVSIRELPCYRYLQRYWLQQPDIFVAAGAAAAICAIVCLWQLVVAPVSPVSGGC